MTNPKVAAEDELTDIILGKNGDAYSKAELILAWHNQQVLTLLQELRSKAFDVDKGQDLSTEWLVLDVDDLDEAMKRYQV